MSNSTKKWYVLYTKPGCEKKVANLLSRRNIENYCPLKRYLNGRKKLMLEPLFNSYVFVQIEEADIMNIQMKDSVVNFVYWLGKPAVIQDEEIEIMKRFMNEYSNVKMERMPFGVNGMVKEGGEAPVDNKVDMVSVKNNTVKIVLPSLGYILLAEAEKINVEVMASAKESYPIEGKYQYAI